MIYRGGVEGWMIVDDAWALVEDWVVLSVATALVDVGVGVEGSVIVVVDVGGYGVRMMLAKKEWKKVEF